MKADIKTSHLKLSSPDSWREILSHPDVSIFHTQGWEQTLESSYGYKPEYLLIEKAGSGTAILPIMEVKSCLTGKRHISLPYSDYCPPLVKGNYSVRDIVTDLIQIGERNGWHSLELRLLNGDEDIEKESCGKYYHHILDLSPGEESIFKKLKEATRRNIRKSWKEGLEVTISEDLADIKLYYNLNCLTRRRHGLPPQPFQFFKCIHEHLIKKRQGIIVLARNRGQIVAGAIFLHVGNKAFYKFGASEKIYQHLRPNNIVLWEGIRWYANNGFKSICFGRNEETNEGLRRYKLGWGAQESMIHYYKYDFRKNGYVKKTNLALGLHTKIFRHAPLFLLRLIGTKIYRHMA